MVLLLSGSLLICILVDAALKPYHPQLPEPGTPAATEWPQSQLMLTQEVRFYLFDANQDGMIDQTENIYEKQYLYTQEFKARDTILRATDLMARFDRDQDGMLNGEETYSCLAAIHRPLLRQHVRLGESHKDIRETKGRRRVVLPEETKTEGN
jgi:Ca2+-binding EF-hand superfamily protein